MSASTATLGFDATTLSGVHINALHVSTPEKILSLSIKEVPGAKAEDYSKHIISAVSELARLYSTWKNEDVNIVKHKFISKINSSMCDRVNTNAAAIELVEEELGKSPLQLHCNVHPLDSMGSSCREALKSYNEDVPSGTFGKDCRAANLIINISKLRYKEGTGDPNGFSLFLQQHGLKLNYFPRYVGNRFNILFHNAGLIFLQRDKLVEYLSTGCNCKTQLRTATLADMQNPDILLQLQALGMFSICKKNWLLSPYMPFVLNFHIVSTKIFFSIKKT